MLDYAKFVFMQNYMDNFDEIWQFMICKDTLDVMIKQNIHWHLFVQTTSDPFMSYSIQW